MSDWSDYDSDFDPTQKLENSDLSEDESPISSRSAAAKHIESSSEEEMSTDDEETDEESTSEDEPESTENVIKVYSDESSDESIERYDDTKVDAQGQEEQKDSDSSSGDENSETCAICLGKLTSTKLPSKPDSGCPHLFCRECLVEWSKQVHLSILHSLDFWWITDYRLFTD